MKLHICSLLLVGSFVSAHGMLYGPNGLADTETLGSTRGYDKVGILIDSLRAPSDPTAFCRNAPASSSRVPFILSPSGSSHSVALAFSLGSQHIGECSLELINPVTNTRTVIASVDGPKGCATMPNISPAFESTKLAPANVQCPQNVPKGLRTNDMCTFDWNFTLMNVENVDCTDCILRWSWTGRHVAATEHFENCIDVTIVKAGGVVASQPVQVPQLDQVVPEMNATADKSLPGNPGITQEVTAVKVTATTKFQAFENPVNSLSMDVPNTSTASSFVSSTTTYISDSPIVTMAPPRLQNYLNVANQPVATTSTLSTSTFTLTSIMQTSTTAMATKTSEPPKVAPTIIPEKPNQPYNLPQITIPKKKCPPRLR
ncbi:hypothetical protein BCR33DRAFT_721950 [Rhizoclosmatium globosum]|uniref:Chitin-binding type-4 domain-containing protein n=1 Tax=Rhizoclosmatium globosum TaxID=329046 RepID=A0A1Y2BPS1_9FUNG|nr:hypothetical protein BCR33DRAFT_721950 [Rhizoclosmatium globosum]|eukprot:ORY36741.1 hypothetical protein BCR33DRAFT_721950 [Rhizoclosmatium globosum]